MRILLLNERDLTHPLAGGVEVHQEEVASRLRSRHGIETTVLCSGYPGGAADEERRGIRFVRLGNRISYYALVPGRARAEIARGGYDLVIENLCKLMFCSPLYLPRVPKLGLVHHLFGLSAFRQVAPPIAAAVLATEAMLPVLYRRWPFVCVSPSSADDLVRRGLPRASIRVIPNAVDHARYSPGAREQVERDLVVFVGRLEHYKGVDILIDAWREVQRLRPGARLEILGDGSARAGLEQRVAASPEAPTIAFRGYATEEQKVAALRRAAVVVQPSRKEGWGLTVIEANACGTPVVGMDVPGLRDSIRHGATGLLSPAGDAVALGGSIVALLSEPALRDRYADAALRFARRFDWDAVSDGFADVARAAAERRPIPLTPDFIGGPVGDDAAPVRRAGAAG